MLGDLEGGAWGGQELQCHGIHLLKQLFFFKGFDLSPEDQL